MCDIDAKNMQQDGIEYGFENGGLLIQLICSLQVNSEARQSININRVTT